MGARRGRGDLDELDDLDGALLVEVEVCGRVLEHVVGGGGLELGEHGGAGAQAGAGEEAGGEKGILWMWTTAKLSGLAGLEAAPARSAAILCDLRCSHRARLAPPMRSPEARMLLIGVLADALWPNRTVSHSPHIFPSPSHLRPQTALLNPLSLPSHDAS